MDNIQSSKITTKNTFFLKINYNITMLIPIGLEWF